jgi:hypothetical protein
MQAAGHYPSLPRVERSIREARCWLRPTGKRLHQMVTQRPVHSTGALLKNVG